MRGRATLLTLSTLTLSLFLIPSVSGQQRPINGCPQPEHGPIHVCIPPRHDSKDSDDDSRGGWRDRDKPDRDYSDRSSSSANTDTQATSNPPAVNGRMRNGRGGAYAASANSTIVAMNQKFALLRKLNDWWGFSEMVINGGGTIPLSVVNDIKPNSAFGSLSYAFRPKYPDAYGHHYLSLNYLGRGLDMDSTWNIVTHHFADVFPADQVDGSSGAIAEGNEYNLVVSLGQGTGIVNHVTVISVTKYTFTLQAGQQHMLRGSVTHGIVKDSNGDVWLFEEGVGVQGEDLRLQAFNYDLADFMWSRMAGNILARLR